MLATVGFYPRNLIQRTEKLKQKIGRLLVLILKYKIMKTIKNDYLIRQFVGSDAIRPAMTKVNFDNGFVYATDAHILCKINADLCVQKYDSVEKYPDVEKVISEHEFIENKTVSVDNLFNDLMKIECCFKPKMIECERCGGSGQHHCDECDYENDCRTCKGTGEVKGSEMVLTSEYDCTLFGKKYKLKYLDLIIKTAVYTEVKEIEISNGKGAGTIFKVGDFTILLMSVYTPD